MTELEVSLDDCADEQEQYHVLVCIVFTA